MGGVSGGGRREEGGGGGRQSLGRGGAMAPRAPPWGRLCMHGEIRYKSTLFQLTLQPCLGNPPINIAGRMLNKDGYEIGQTEVFKKTLKRKKVVESYFDAASIIDINNHLRQGGLALETAWQTQSWACCVISKVLGMVETDAYLLFKWFHQGYTKMSHLDFTESVDEALLTSTNKRKRTQTQEQDSHEKFPHNIAPLSLHPLYDKNSASCVATYASRTCSVCNSPCKNYSTVCSEM